MILILIQENINILILIIFIFIQEKCEKVVDKYIEYDAVIIFLDALLHKPQAYRHLLFNIVVQVISMISISCTCMICTP